MNDHRRKRALVCLFGLVVGLLLTGGTLLVRRRALRRTVSTFHTPLAGEAAWQGEWKLSEWGADPSRAGSLAQADRVTIPFTGTHLAVRVRRGGYRAYFWVSVDSEPANRLPQTENGAYLPLSSPDYESQVVTIPVAGGLDDGRHVAVITADRGWDQWPLVGWRASRRPDTAPYRWALAAAAVVNIVCLAGVIWWGGMWLGGEEAGKREGTERKEAQASVLPSYRLPFNIPPSLSVLQSPFSILVAGGVFYVSPWLPLTLLSGGVLGALVLLRLDLGLALAALTAPFYLHPRPLLGKSFSMMEIATLLCLASWGGRWVVQHLPSSNRHAPSSLDLAILIFVLVSIISAFTAEHRHVALRELRLVVVEPVLFYLILRTTKFDEEAIWRIVNGFVGGAIVVALIGLAQYALDVNVITAEQGFRRLRSVYGSPNNAALYLGRALPVLVAIALFGGSRHRRVIYGTFAAPVALAVLLSFSRGAILLGVPSALLALGMLAGGRWLWASLGVLALGAAGIIPLMSTPRFASLLDPHSGTLFLRLQLWRASWMMFRDHPLFGVGPDNFLYQYRGRYILPRAWQEPHLSHAHNVVFDYTTRLGLVGLIAGAWLQVASWRLALPLRDIADRDRRALALGLTGSMVYSLAHGLVDASYFFADLALAFFLTLGLVKWLHRSCSR